MRARPLLLLCAVLLAGCGAPSAALLPNLEPRGEALAYFGPDAPALALVDTEPDRPGVRALGSALVRTGAYNVLRGAAKERGLIPRQLRPLLGGELVVGIPQPGSPPLAALVTQDAGALRTLADSRVVGGRATVAGSYRGASLFAARDHAYAVRGSVLLVSRSTADLRDALDRRASDDTFKGEDLEDALPRVKGRPLARAFVDLDARVGPRGRVVPWLAALDTLGVVARATKESARVDFRVATTADGLLEVDVPVSPGERAPLAVTAPAPSLTVRDLAHTLGVLEAAGRVAFPLAALRLDQARTTLRKEGRVDVGEDVVARLHGPATVVHGRDGVLLRADPSRPRALGRALARLARALPDGLDRARLNGFSVRERSSS